MEKSMELLHGEKYPQAMKVAKRFVSKSATRPVLLFTQHRKDGAIVATNSHKLLEIRNIHGFKEDYLVHPRTGEFAKGNFPDARQITDVADYKTVIKLNKEQIKIWLQIHKSINQLTRSVFSTRQHATLVLSDKPKVKVDNKNEISFDLPYENYEEQDHLEIDYSPEYMRDALEAHDVMESESVEISVNGNTRPVHLDGGNVKSVVLPMRVY